MVVGGGGWLVVVGVGWWSVVGTEEKSSKNRFTNHIKEKREVGFL